MATEAAMPTTALPASLKPVLLLLGIAAAVAVGVGVVLWSRGPSYSLLYANLAPEDQAQIAQALDAAQIPYRLQPGSNAIEVAADRLSDARLKLAGQGLPEGGNGFALLDKDPGFGVSQFVENARYQHALETELARTIASLRPVESARVHLAVPRQSAFVRDRRSASASVFVQVKPGHSLTQEQVEAIANLVASSIPDLEASRVTVVDQRGRLLSAPAGSDPAAAREQQLDAEQRLEDDYRQRIVALLEPLVGIGRVRAQLVAQVDGSVTEEAREQYRPNSQIVRSEQLSQQSSRDGAGPQGVPGALTNQPPPAGVAAPPAPLPAGGAAAANASAPGGASPAAPASGTAAAGAARGAPAAAPVTASAAEPESNSSQTTRNYEIDRTLDYTHQPAGRLKRITVAVLIDNLHVTAKDGTVSSVPLTPQQIDHITQLVKDAVGFDPARGDSVNVLNSSFTQEPAAPEGELQAPALWERPLFRELVKLVAGAAVLIVLLLAVLRPLARSLITFNQAPAAALPGPGGAEAAAAELPRAATPAALASHEQQLAQARSLVTQDPKRVAQVVRGWVNRDE
jgi:flagellar M-ring protein FliF